MRLLSTELRWDALYKTIHAAVGALVVAMEMVKALLVVVVGAHSPLELWRSVWYPR